MARIRTIKPEFFRHHGLFLAEVETGLPLRLAFAGLWTCADREGRFKWKPAELKLDCLPHDEVDFARVLDELAARKFIIKYAIGGRDYGCIPSWKDHQFINNREKESAIPAPTETNAQTSRVNDESTTRAAHDTNLHEWKGKEGEGEGKRNIKGGENSASLRSADAPAGAPIEKIENGDLEESAPEAPSDPEITRKQLFNQGLKALVDLSGRRELACRTHLGSLLRDCENNPVPVLAAIRAAQQQPQPLADAFAWLTAAVQHRTRKRGGTLEMLREALTEMRAARGENPDGEKAA